MPNMTSVSLKVQKLKQMLKLTTDRQTNRKSDHSTRGHKKFSAGKKSGNLIKIRKSWKKQGTLQLLFNKVDCRLFLFQIFEMKPLC